MMRIIIKDGTYHYSNRIDISWNGRKKGSNIIIIIIIIYVRTTYCSQQGELLLNNERVLQLCYATIPKLIQSNDEYMPIESIIEKTKNKKLKRVGEKYIVLYLFREIGWNRMRSNEREKQNNK
jgi:hypothetical protein